MITTTTTSSFSDNDNDVHHQPQRHHHPHCAAPQQSRRPTQQPQPSVSTTMTSLRWRQLSLADDSAHFHPQPLDGRRRVTPSHTVSTPAHQHWRVYLFISAPASPGNSHFSPSLIRRRRRPQPRPTMTTALSLTSPNDGCDGGHPQSCPMTPPNPSLV